MSQQNKNEFEDVPIVINHISVHIYITFIGLLNIDDCIHIRILSNFLSLISIV